MNFIVKRNQFGYCEAEIIDKFKLEAGWLLLVESNITYEDEFQVLWIDDLRRTNATKVQYKTNLAMKWNEDPVYYSAETLNEAEAIFEKFKEGFTTPWLIDMIELTKGIHETRKKFRRPRDTKRDQVYSWGTVFRHEETMLCEQVEELVKRVSVDAKQKMVPTCLFKGRDTGCGRFSAETLGVCKNAGWTLWFNTHGRTTNTVLHEMAHSLLKNTPKQFFQTDPYRKEASHGARFMGLQMYLFNRYMDVPMLKMIAEADRRNIPYEFPGITPW